jgi:2-amino-4-hydroxy-6-hydroxymethyldihydropteridine diphosphokinase
MSVIRSFIGLGSNMGDGPAIIGQALEGLGLVKQTRLVRVSSFYRSAAWGRENQADFTNAVAELETTLTARQLLRALLGLETTLGRTRDTGRWGPRLIDLDLLTFGEELMCSPDLTLPHPRMHERAFVLIPLVELDPGFRIPGLGLATDCLEKLPDQAVQIIN